jgi:hypothetical protein
MLSGAVPKQQIQRTGTEKDCRTEEMHESSQIRGLVVRKTEGYAQEPFVGTEKH